MQDLIVEGYLKEFVKAFKLHDLKSTEAFEHFINFLIITRDYPDVFELDAVSMGGGNDLGIDGLAIIVNEHLVFSTEAVEYFSKQLRRLDATFLFVQSKTSASFDSGDMGNFLFGVRTFFGGTGVENDDIQEARSLKDHIYSLSGDMDRSPVCELVYATLGKWTDDPTLTHRIEAELQLLRDTNLFSEVKFTPMDAEAIKAAYRELNRRVAKEIVFERHTNLAAISGVEQAYIGSIPAGEYLKLICDTQGRLQRSLFYDNVRDFQGNNSVNQDIAKTLDDSSLRDKFTVLNNGITIVAQSLNQVGPKFKLSDFQIVNGCQTSHILYAAKDRLDNVEIPIKLIVTKDQDVTNLVIKATNRQTEVKEEAFESLNPFQKELEEFYSAVEDQEDKKLFYERRSKQYDHISMDRKRVISLTGQIKSFISMFLNEPHSTHRYYGEILEANRSRIFLADHSPYPYYLAAKALFVFDGMISREMLPKRYGIYKYHILMLLRALNENTALPQLNSRKSMPKYCESLLSLLNDEKVSLKAFERCANIIDEQIKQGAFGYGGVRLKTFTNRLIDAAKAGAPADAPVVRERGYVKIFSDVKGFGFVHSDTRNADLFVHYKEIRGTGFKTLANGALVEFTVVTTPKGLSAVDVSLGHDS